MKISKRKLNKDRLGRGPPPDSMRDPFYNRFLKPIISHAKNHEIFFNF